MVTIGGTIERAAQPMRNKLTGAAQNEGETLSAKKQGIGGDTDLSVFPFGVIDV